MAVRSGARWRWAGGLVFLALALITLGRFMATQGLENADRWASVIGVFPGLIGLVVAVYSLIRDRRAVSPDGEQGTASGPAPVAADHITAEAPAGTAPQGNTENHVSGGTFHGPLIMGRDMHGLVLPPPPPRPEGDADGVGR